MTMALGHNMASWCWERPSTSVLGDTRVPPPGYRGGHDERAESMMAQSIRVELHELATLQDFPPDHPWVGTRTSVARQIGNAFPPSAAEAVVRQLLATDGE